MEEAKRGMRVMDYNCNNIPESHAATEGTGGETYPSMLSDNALGSHKAKDWRIDPGRICHVTQAEFSPFSSKHPINRV